MAGNTLKVFIAAALAALPISAPAAFQDEQAAASAHSDTLREAHAYLEAESFEAQIMQSSRTTMEFMIATMLSEIEKQSSEPIPEDFIAEVRELFLEHSRVTLQSQMQSIKNAAARIYAEEFTAEELVRLREIASDPVMVKARERSKVMDPKLMALGIQTMKAAEPDLQAKLRRLISEFEAKESGSTDRS